MVKALRNNILNILGLNKTNGMYGIEIETEGRFLPNNLNEYWRIDADPSLKSGLESFEYVLARPLDIDDCKKALDYLSNKYKEYGTKVEETDTSGVHVHLNVQEYTPKQLYNLFVAYLTLEEIILTYCGDMREGNHFCLRSQDAEALIFSLTQAAIKRNLKPLNTDRLRYASLNVYSLFKYGSVEFRAMRGTGDLDAIFTWVEILDRIRQEALNYATPSDILLSFSQEGERAYLKKFLKDKANLFYKVENFEQMLQNGVRRCQSIAFLPDWDAWKDERKNPFPIGNEQGLRG